MSKIFSSKKKEVSKTEIDPRIYDSVLRNLQFAEQVAATPYEPYRGMMVAPFTRDYMAGEDMTRRIAREGGFVPEVEQAARAAQSALGFQPERIQAGRVGTTFGARDIAAPGAAPTVRGAGFLESDLGQYMNPYERGVIETGLEDIGRAEERARASRSARATAARAFGGSRAAIEEGIAAGEAARERNRFVAEQRARGFEQAAALREADVGREQEARLANQAAAQNVMELAQRGEITNQQRDLELGRLGLTAETANVQAAMEAARANQSAGIQGAQFGLAAGRQLADLGQQALQNRYGAGAAMMGLGTQQQQLYQQFLNAQREEEMRRQMFPLQQLAIRQGAVQASPMNVTQTGTVTSRPSYWDMAGRVIGAAAPFMPGSDERMKRDIKSIKNPLDKVRRLKGIEFEWEDGYGENEGDDNGGEEDMGMSAQSVERAMPEAVSRRQSDGMRQYDLPQVVGLLTEAVKELDKKVGGKRRGSV